jgi:hypothetical protein
MAPLQRGAALFPAAAIRSDPGLLLTAARFLGPEMLALGLVAGQLTVGGASWVSALHGGCFFETLLYMHASAQIAPKQAYMASAATLSTHLPVPSIPTGSLLRNR